MIFFPAPAKLATGWILLFQAFGRGGKILISVKTLKVSGLLTFIKFIDKMDEKSCLKGATKFNNIQMYTSDPIAFFDGQ